MKMIYLQIRNILHCWCDQAFSSICDFSHNDSSGQNSGPENNDHNEEETTWHVKRIAVEL